MSQSLLIEDGGSWRDRNSLPEHFSAQLWQLCNVEQRMKMLILGSSDGLSLVMVRSAGKGQFPSAEPSQIPGAEVFGRV